MDGLLVDSLGCLMVCLSVLRATVCDGLACIFVLLILLFALAKQLICV